MKDKLERLKHVYALLILSITGTYFVFIGGLGACFTNPRSMQCRVYETSFWILLGISVLGFLICLNKKLFSRFRYVGIFLLTISYIMLITFVSWIFLFN